MKSIRITSHCEYLKLRRLHLQNQKKYWKYMHLGDCKKKRKKMEKQKKKSLKSPYKCISFPQKYSRKFYIALLPSYCFIHVKYQVYLKYSKTNYAKFDKIEKKIIDTNKNNKIIKYFTYSTLALLYIHSKQNEI